MLYSDSVLSAVFALEIKHGNSCSLTTLIVVLCLVSVVTFPPNVWLTAV